MHLKKEQLWVLYCIVLYFVVLLMEKFTSHHMAWQLEPTYLRDYVEDDLRIDGRKLYVFVNY